MLCALGAASQPARQPSSRLQVASSGALGVLVLGAPRDERGEALDVDASARINRRLLEDHVALLLAELFAPGGEHVAESEWVGWDGRKRRCSG